MGEPLGICGQGRYHWKTLQEIKNPAEKGYQVRMGQYGIGIGGKA